MNRHTALALAGVALLSLATGCSDDKKVSLPGVVTAGDQSDDTSGGGVSLPTDAALGSCHVTVTGDVETEWTSPGGASAVGYGPWVPKSVGTALGTLDESFFIINCQGEGADYVGFLTANDSKIPMQPATYTIEESNNAFGASEHGMITTLLGFENSETNWGPSAQGELVITAFDESHIAGTFRIPIKDVLTGMNGAGEGEALIVGEFDYANPN